MTDRKSKDESKVATHARLDRSVRQAAIDSLRRGETLTEFIEEALKLLVEKRRQAPEPDTSGAKLIRGSRPRR